MPRTIPLGAPGLVWLKDWPVKENSSAVLCGFSGLPWWSQSCGARHQGHRGVGSPLCSRTKTSAGCMGYLGRLFCINPPGALTCRSCPLESRAVTASCHPIPTKRGEACSFRHFCKWAKPSALALWKTSYLLGRKQVSVPVRAVGSAHTHTQAHTYCAFSSV